MDPVSANTNEPPDGSNFFSLNWSSVSGEGVDAVSVEDSSGKRCVYNYGPGVVSGDGLKPPTTKAIADYDICSDDYDPPAPNTVPTVTILYLVGEPPLPGDDDPIPGGTAVTFQGAVLDEDDDLENNLQWVSSLDGVLDPYADVDGDGLPDGDPSEFTVTDLSAGPHTITAQVADGGGLIGTASIDLQIDGAVQQCEPTGGGDVYINGVLATCPDPEVGPRLVCSADLDVEADKFQLGVTACCLCNATAKRCDENLPAGADPDPITGLEPCPDATIQNKDAVQVPTTLMFNNDPYYCITVGGRRTCYKY
jgi:hypothetical protein